MKRRFAPLRLFLLSLMLTLPLLTLPARGTTVLKMSLAEMTDAAEIAVEGTVVSKNVRWDEDHQYIITEVTVEVAKSLKGNAPARIVVRVLGGEVGDVGLFVAGSPEFEVGEEVLLLLERHPKKDWRIVGFHQGKFDIKKDPKTGKKNVHGPAQPTPAPLEDVEAKIRGRAAGNRP